MPQTRDSNGQFEKAPNVSESERTGDQSNHGSGYDGWVDTASSFYPAIGGSWANPMGFPGYGSTFYGTYPTYRWILQLPPVRFVRSIRSGAILASTWEAVPSRKGVPDAIVEEVQDMLNRLRPQLVHDFYLRGTDMGHAGGEIIWEKDGEDSYRIERVKPLLVEDVQYLVDKKGNFTGIENNDVKIFAPFKAFKYTYDGEAGNHYGRSWLENIRATAVKDWLDCLQQLQRIGSKISGVVTIVMAPAGEFPGVDKDGNAVKFTYKVAAKAFIEGLARGAAGGYMPNITIGSDARGGMDMLQFMRAVYGKSLVSIDVKDFSGNAGAILPILDRMKHAEELIFNGGLRSSRTGLEAQHGTKEEAGTHTDTGTINAEVEDEDFANQVTPLIDAQLVVRHGSRMKGAVHAHAPSLVDRKSAVLKALLMSAMNVPEFAIEYMRSIGAKGINAINKALDIPQEKELDTGKLVLTKQQPPAEKPAGGGGAAPDPQGGRPTN